MDYRICPYCLSFINFDIHSHYYMGCPGQIADFRKGVIKTQEQLIKQFEIIQADLSNEVIFISPDDERFKKAAKDVLNRHNEIFRKLAEND